MNDITRLNYFNSQFLVDTDFKDEQGYHVGMRRMHNLKLHGWGIADGLEVSYPGSGTALSVSAGAAIDAQGRELVLTAPASIDPGALALGATIWISIAYAEGPAGDAVTLGQDTFHTRTVENTTLTWSATFPAQDGSVLLLARVVYMMVNTAPAYIVDGAGFRTLSGRGVQPSSSLTVRNIRVTGNADLPASDVGTPMHGVLRVSGHVVIDPNEMLSGTDGIPALSLFSPQRDTGFHLTCIPYLNYSRALSISAGGAPGQNPDMLTMSMDGNIGINNPQPDFVRGSHGGGLALRVNAAIVAENSDLYFTNPGHHHTGVGNMPGCAAIENSAADEYNALMILGRNVGAGPGEAGLHRVVKLWDELTVYGPLSVGDQNLHADLHVWGNIYYWGKLIYNGPGSGL